MSVIAEGEERGKGWCPLLRSCCPGGVARRQDWGLAQPVLRGWAVRGRGEGSSVPRGNTLRHVLRWGALCCLLSEGWGCDSHRQEGREGESALGRACVYVCVSWGGSQGPHLLELAL